jgi:inorganic pyrophosphatase
VARFKEALKLGQSLDDRENDQKLSCVSNIKNLIKNYKNVVESQEQLLGKVVLKAKEFKASEMQAL